MGERRHLLTPSFNRSVQVEGRDERLDTAGGAVLLREIMQLSGLRRFLADRDCRTHAGRRRSGIPSRIWSVPTFS